jgi:hypothetical protein
MYRLSKLVFRGGYTQAEMMEIINNGRDEEHQISQSMISRDLTSLREEWANKRIDNIDYLINRELARIDFLEENLWEALEETGKTTTRTHPDGSQTRIVERGGKNAALFAQIQSVQKERRRLLGLYGPALNLTANIEVKGYKIVSPDDWPGQESKVIDGEYHQLGDGE